jgi:hypothetical protein
LGCQIKDRQFGTVLGLKNHGKIGVVFSDESIRSVFRDPDCELDPDFRRFLFDHIREEVCAEGELPQARGQEVQHSSAEFALAPSYLPIT